VATLIVAGSAEDALQAVALGDAETVPDAACPSPAPAAAVRRADSAHCQRVPPYRR
jgi:hypothetical protein